MITLCLFADQHIYEVIRRTRPARMYLIFFCPEGAYQNADDAVEAYLDELNSFAPPMKKHWMGRRVVLKRVIKGEGSASGSYYRVVFTDCVFDRVNSDLKATVLAFANHLAPVQETNLTDKPDKKTRKRKTETNMATREAGDADRITALAYQDAEKGVLRIPLDVKSYNTNQTLLMINQSEMIDPSHERYHWYEPMCRDRNGYYEQERKEAYEEGVDDDDYDDDDDVIYEDADKLSEYHAVVQPAGLSRSKKFTNDLTYFLRRRLRARVMCPGGRWYMHRRAKRNKKAATDLDTQEWDEGVIRYEYAPTFTKRTTVLVIESDADIAATLADDVALLEEMDPYGLLYATTRSLCTSPDFSYADIARWLGRENDQCAYKMIDRFKSGKCDDSEEDVGVIEGEDEDDDEERRDYTDRKVEIVRDHQHLASCDFAVSVLRKMYAVVHDMREDPRLLRKPGDVILPAVAPREEDDERHIDEPVWTPVHKRTEYAQRLQLVLGRDNRYKGSVLNETRVTVFVAGQMGVGKTEGALEHCLYGLSRARYRNVLYLAPRTALVMQMHQRVLNMLREDPEMNHGLSPDHKMRYIDVRCYCGGAPTPQPVKMDLSPYGVFTLACVNSIAKTAELYDAVIVDEAATDLTNLSINFSSAVRFYDGFEPSLKLDRDETLIDQVTMRLNSAAVMIVMEAAFTKEVIAVFNSIGQSDTPATAQKIRECLQQKDAQTAEKYSQKRAARDWLSKRKAEGALAMIDEKKNAVYKRLPAVYLAVYDTKHPKGIFSKIVEMRSYDALVERLLGLIETEQTWVVYVSSARTAAELTNLLRAQAKGKRAIKILLITGNVMNHEKDIGDDKKPYLVHIRHAHGVIATSVMSCGLSYDSPVDHAFTVVENGVHYPSGADMLQMAGRFRNITCETLYYCVKSVAPYDEAETNHLAAMDHRRGRFKEKETHKLVDREDADRYKAKSMMSKSVVFASETAREGFVKGFSVAVGVDANGYLEYIEPAWEKCLDEPTSKITAAKKLTRLYKTLVLDTLEAGDLYPCETGCSMGVAKHDREKRHYGAYNRKILCLRDEVGSDGKKTGAVVPGLVDGILSLCLKRKLPDYGNAEDPDKKRAKYDAKSTRRGYEDVEPFEACRDLLMGRRDTGRNKGEEEERGGGRR